MSAFGVVLAAVVLAGSAPHRIELATGQFDGRNVLGRSVAGVTAALGTPSFRGPRIVGWGDPRRFSYEVLFRRVEGHLRASTIVLEQGEFRDPRIGSLLARSPATLRRKVVSVYGFVEQQPYRCRNGICDGVLAAGSGRVHLTYGRTRARGTFVSVWRAYS